MLSKQELLDPAPSLLESPANWSARRDYRRALQMARSLDLQEHLAVFLDHTPRNAARYRWGLFYPLACLPLIAVILLLLIIMPTNLGWLASLLFFVLLILLIYVCVAFTYSSLNISFLHCEQIHLYANGFVAIDARGQRQGARWDQLFDFRRGAHEFDQRFGRVRWDSIRAGLIKRRRGQRPTLKITPHLPDSTEICARIERAYSAFWLPRFREQFSIGEVLDFDALLISQDWLGKTTPGKRRFTASLPQSATPPSKRISTKPGMARGFIIPAGKDTAVEWLRRNEIKSIRVDDRFIQIRTIEPVSRDKQGRADRLWFRLDTLGLKDAAILKEMISDI